MSMKTCSASQEIKKKILLPLLKQAKNESKVDFFHHIKLIIKDKTISTNINEVCALSNFVNLNETGSWRHQWWVALKKFQVVWPEPGGSFGAVGCVFAAAVGTEDSPGL